MVSSPFDFIMSAMTGGHLPFINLYWSLVLVSALVAMLLLVMGLLVPALRRLVIRDLLPATRIIRHDVENPVGKETVFLCSTR